MPIIITYKKFAYYLRKGNAQTEFRAATFQTVCYQLEQNNNQTVQFKSQQHNIEMKII